MQLDFLILADRAEAINGKLYMVGGGFDRVGVPALPGNANYDIALGFLVEYNETNHPHEFGLTVHDEDGRRDSVLRRSRSPNSRILQVLRADSIGYTDMYVPAHFKPEDAEVRTLLASGRAANLITATADGLMATMLPLVWDGPDARPGLGPWGALLGHVARNNGQWKVPAIGEAMVILAGPDAYISPAWYSTKREHGRVVPTWNYITAHAHGRLVVHDDPQWVEANVRRLADHHEASRSDPWSVDDAPEPYIKGQLRAIVGVEILIDRVEGKWKLSQNRSDADVAGTIEGLEATGQREVSAAMRDLGRGR